MPLQYQKRRTYVTNKARPSFVGSARPQTAVKQPLQYQWNGRFLSPYAYGQNTGGEMEQVRRQIDRLYNLRRGKSFKGFCGLYVDFQLRALGIFPPNTSFLGHGNTWFAGVGVQHVSRQYRLKKYPGPNCLEDILRDSGGSAAHNIVVSFSRGRFGHVLFIHAILNGRVIFTDSFAFHNIEERKMHILSMPAFKQRYIGKGHRIIGALHFIRIG